MPGGTKGIGLAIVEGFLEEGAEVYFCARTRQDVDHVTQQFRDKFSEWNGNGAVVDVSDASSLESWVQEIAHSRGRIDVVVANVSAVAIPNTPENWIKSLHTDLMGTYYLVEAALPYLVKSSGNILGIGSVTGREVDFTAPSPYGIAKVGIIHYMAQLARTLAPKGVRANTVSPGNTYVEDGVWGAIEKNAPDLFKSQLAANPTGRMARPQEIADAVIFLASEKASFISGANLNVNGALSTGIQF